MPFWSASLPKETGDLMIGFYFLCFLLFCSFAIDAELTVEFLQAAAIKFEVYVVNLRLKWASWRMYRKLVKLCKESGFPSPGPFRYVDIWDRDR